jgi:hypothetical protein
MMTARGKITRHTIVSEETPAFWFLGVVSSEPDYRLSVMMNRGLGIDLRKCHDDIIISTKSEKKVFTRFASVNPALTLVSNHGKGSILIPKLKNIDFLLIISGQHDRNKADELAGIIRKIPEVTAVFLLDSSEIGDRNLSLLVAL